MEEYGTGGAAVIALRHRAASAKALPSKYGFRPDPCFCLAHVVVRAILVVVHGMDRHADLASVTYRDLDRIIVD